MLPPLAGVSTAACASNPFILTGTRAKLLSRFTFLVMRTWAVLHVTSHFSLPFISIQLDCSVTRLLRSNPLIQDNHDSSEIHEDNMFNVTKCHHSLIYLFLMLPHMLCHRFGSCSLMAMRNVIMYVESLNPVASRAQCKNK